VTGAFLHDDSSVNDAARRRAGRALHELFSPL